MCFCSIYFWNIFIHARVVILVIQDVKTRCNMINRRKCSYLSFRTTVPLPRIPSAVSPCPVTPSARPCSCVSARRFMKRDSSIVLIIITELPDNSRILIYHNAGFEFVIEQRNGEFENLSRAGGNVDEVRLLVTHRRAVLYASQYIANIREGPRAEVAHGKSRFVVDVRVTVDLILLVVQQSFRHHAVHSRHVYRREFGGIETSLKTKSDKHICRMILVFFFFLLRRLCIYVLAIVTCAGH